MPYQRRGLEILPEDIPLNIVYEDDDVLVLNKEAGMVVHPGHGHFSGTLVNALAHHLGISQGPDAPPRPWVSYILAPRRWSASTLLSRPTCSPSSTNGVNMPRTWFRKNNEKD